MLQAKIDGEWVELPEGTSATISYGDVTPIYDICGCMGLCKECSEDGVAVGCGERYVAYNLLEPSDDQWLVTLPDGTELWADDFQVIDIVMGEETDDRLCNLA